MTELTHEGRRRTRVLHIVQNLNYGGMERLMFDLIRSMDERDFEVYVLALEYVGRFGRDLGTHATVSVASSMGAFSMLRPTALAADIRRIGPDVVHCHSGVWHKASLAARMAGVRRIIFTEHGRAFPDPLVARVLDWLAAKRAHVVVAVSQPVADHLSRLVHVDRKLLRVVPNGVDASRFASIRGSSGIRAEFGLDASRPIIGSVGRLEPVKAYDAMIHGFARLHSRWGDGPSPVLVVAGDGSARPQLEELVRELDLEGSVFLPGWRDDLEELYSAFSCFCMSSLSEGTSISLLEAMSAGLCPVVTDVGGNGHVLGKELNHRLVPQANPSALAEALYDVLADPARRESDGASARSRVLAHFSLQSMVAAYQALYVSADLRQNSQRG